MSGSPGARPDGDRVRPWTDATRPDCRGARPSQQGTKVRPLRAQTPPYRPGRRCERGGPERRSKSNDQMREKVFITVFLPDAVAPTAPANDCPPGHLTACLLLRVKPPKPKESGRSGSHGRAPPDSGRAGHRGGTAPHSQKRKSGSGHLSRIAHQSARQRASVPAKLWFCCNRLSGRDR